MGVLLQAAGLSVLGVYALSWTKPSYTQRKFKESPTPKGLLQLRTRSENVSQLHDYQLPECPLDALIVGGGSVGAGVALDATLRGLKVGLVEMQDYASGTSSRSTKLLHGGIRYLEKAILKLSPTQLGLVSEALRERSILIHQAPHLCSPLPIIVPCYNVFEMIKYYIGLKVYDLVAACVGGTLSYSRFVAPYEALRLHPYLCTTSPTNSALLGAIEYTDGQMNDARLCLSVALTASSLGAAVANYSEVLHTEVVENNRCEKVVRATIKDHVTQETYVVCCRVLVNAGGPFAEKIDHLDEQMKRKSTTSQFTVVPSIGSHIIVDRKFCPRDHTGLVVPSSDGRVVFMLPWLHGCLMGTTDIPCDVTTDPKPSLQEVNFLLDNAVPFVGHLPKESVKSSWAGIRPLAVPASTANGSNPTENIVREHIICTDKERLNVSVSGGKWTTYRKIAEEVVDTTIKNFFSSQTRQGASSPLQKCSTENVVLVGAQELGAVPENPSIPKDIYRHWKGHYGDRLPQLAALLAAEGVDKTGMKSCKRLGNDQSPVAEVEVIYASRYEHCEHIDDFLSRRTRMSFVDAKMADSAIKRVADILAAEKGWTKRKKMEEIDLAQRSLESFMVGVSAD